MERARIDDQDVEKVVGGSIVFNTSRTNDQYTVNDFGKALEYIAANYKTMGEREMLENIAALGYITPIGG